MRLFKNHDWLITIILSFLAVLSLLLIFSTTYTADNPQEGQGAVLRQIVFFGVGYLVYFALSTININWLKQRGVILLIAAFMISTLVYVIAFPNPRAETLRWILLGPLSFQPAEFAKIGVVILTAYVLTREQDKLPSEVSKTQNYLKYILAALIIATTVVLVFLQQSLGNSLIIITIWGSVMLCYVPISSKLITTILISITGLAAYYQILVFSGLPAVEILGTAGWQAFIFLAMVILFFVLSRLYKYGLTLIIIGIGMFFALGPLAQFTYHNVLAPYQRERVETFVSANSNSEEQAYQVRQSIIAVGSGQILGRGYLQGRQSTLQVLPFAHTDFIFAALAEQFGFIGISVIFALYAALIYRIIKVSLDSEDQFAKLVSVGCASIIMINCFINVGMNLGLLPVTGVPLPLISHGGSSVLVIMTALGIVQITRSSLKSKNYAEKLHLGLAK